MTTTNIMNVRSELCHFLRGSDVLTTTVRGVTRVTGGTYTVGAGGEATHTFTGYTPTHNIKSITVDGTAKYYLRDWTIVWSTGVLTWNVALTVGQVVVYTLDYGSSADKIYPDFPRDEMTLSSYPRIGIELTSVTTSPFNLGGSAHISDYLFTIQVFVPANGSTDPLAYLEEIHRLIRDALRTSAKTFYTFQYIYPSGMSPLIGGKNSKLLGKSADYRIRFNVE